ncbi:PhlD [Streptomyces sp. DSM 42041]|uniref:PhlD n=1 Tax=Streptomyces hazeniae TaxID=3075538 RepID=A0ABU2NYL0_9ACTN|nr:PhlD [Streptomyces sp. DSM 42041]MDT0382077.1 PhlD [Streptomyces sp. DSM 42041]
MTVAYSARPEVAVPAHEVTTDQILADITARHPGHPKLVAIRRVISRLGVERRRFMRPLPEVTGTTEIAARNRQAYEDARDHAVLAVSRLLDRTGTDPSRVDAVVTSHTTSWTSPGLDVALCNAFGLRPDAARVPMGSLGCVGGAHALARAADLLRTGRAETVLVVVAETLSTVYQHADTTLEAMIYKALFGDSAAATLVTRAPAGPGFAVTDHTEILLPHSTDRYRGRLDAGGLHFDSTGAALTATGDVLPHLRPWLDTHPAPAWAVVHPGGPRILTDTAAALGLDAERDLRHSWHSLRERGNLGGAAVLDVLARHHDDPPPPGAPGLLLAYGPGFTATALTGHWHTP